MRGLRARGKRGEGAGGIKPLGGSASGQVVGSGPGGPQSEQIWQVGTVGSEPTVPIFICFAEQPSLRTQCGINLKQQHANALP